MAPIVAAAGLFVLIAALYVLARPIIRGAIYFPAPPPVVRAALALAAVKHGERMADLGSGDGRIVAAFAHAGAIATGYEVNPLLSWRSRRAIAAMGLKGARVLRKDFWREDLAGFDIIVAFGTSRIMRQLSAKLRRNAKTGARIISIEYPLPNLRLVRREEVGRYSLYLYELPPAEESVPDV